MKRRLFEKELNMPCAIMKRSHSKKRQRGQALYLGLAAIVFLSLMTYAAFNISQMTHAKTQTMNAADAGAYTLATVVARDLNFMAYTNRAMAANHAVIGQLVSMASLSQMIHMAADDITKLEYLSFIPGIGAVFNAIAKAFKLVKLAIEKGILPALRIAAIANNGIIKGISVMQQGVHAATAYDAQDAVKKVIKANDPELEWATASLVGGLTTASNVASTVKTFAGDFTRQVKSTDSAGLGRMREVVNLSRDGFTIKRCWFPVPYFPGPVPMRVKAQCLFKGGTQLSSDNKTWVGVDAAEIGYQKLEWVKWKGWRWKTKYLRWGWETGEVAGNSYASDWKSLSHGDLSSGGHQLAYNKRRDKMQDTYDGIQPYQELTSFKAGDRSSDSPTYVVAVYKPIKDSNSTRNANQTFQTTDEDNPFHLKEGRTKVYGVAASQVYFRRPTKNDNDTTANSLRSDLYNRGTHATLFAPYWQARLTDLPPLTKAALIAVDK